MSIEHFGTSRLSKNSGAGNRSVASTRVMGLATNLRAIAFGLWRMTFLRSSFLRNTRLLRTAAVEVYGGSLGGLIEEFFGPGDWSPRSSDVPAA